MKILFNKNSKLFANIEFSDESNVQNSTDTFKAKSIVQHEICHCIEINQWYHGNALNTENSLNENFQINTTYNFLYSEAVNIWPEFFVWMTYNKFRKLIP